MNIKLPEEEKNKCDSIKSCPFGKIKRCTISMMEDCELIKKGVVKKINLQKGSNNNGNQI